MCPRETKPKINVNDASKTGDEISNLKGAAQKEQKRRTEKRGRKKNKTKTYFSDELTVPTPGFPSVPIVTVPCSPIVPRGGINNTS